MATSTFIADMDATQDTSFFVGMNAGTGSTTAYDSAQAHVGTGSLKCVVTNSGQTASPYTIDGTVSDTGNCVSAWFRFSTVSPATLTNFMMCLTSANGSGRIGLGINTNGTLNFANKGATLQANGSTVLVANTWYRISMSYTNATSSTWAAKVYINGTLEINASAAVQGNNTAGSVACISFGQNASSLGSFSTPAVSTVWIDSMYIDNRTDLTDCGAIDVTSKRPFSNGTTNGFTTQVGSGGSGYGSGHTPQVNERPLSVTNGWSMIGAGSAITEEYTIEGAAVGDVDISAATIKDFMGWVYAKALASETASIVLAGSTSSISLTSTNTLFMKAAGSTTYPTGGTDIGIVTTTALTTVSLYECGIMFAYIPASGTAYTMSVSGTYSASGAISRKISRNLTASYSSSGTLKKAISRLFNPSYSTSGILKRTTARTLSATYSTSGILSNIHQHYQSLAAIFSASGIMTKRTARPFSANYQGSGALNRSFSRLFTANYRAIGSTGNIVINGDFEIGTGTTNANFSVTGWAISTPANATVISIDAVQVYNGVQSLKMAVDATNSLNGIHSSSNITVLPNTAYYLSMYVISDTAGQLQLQLREHVSSGNYVQTDGITWNATATYQSVNTTTQWSQYIFRLVTGAAQTTLAISDLKRSGNGSQASRTFNLDLVMISRDYILKQTNRSLQATYSDSGSVNKNTNRSLNGSYSVSGSLVRRLNRLFVATYSTTGSLIRSISRSLSGLFTSNGSLSRNDSKQLSASFISSGNLAKRTNRTLTATEITNGSLSRSLSRSLVATFSTSGFLGRGVSRVMAALFKGSGSINKSTNRSINGNYQTAGSIKKQSNRSFAATDIKSGSIARQTNKYFSATASFSPSLMYVLLSVKPAIGVAIILSQFQTSANIDLGSPNTKIDPNNDNQSIVL